MSDNRRVDLSSDLDSLLQDVKAATEEVRIQQQKNKQKDRQVAEKEKSRKQSSWLILGATVVLLVVAYFVVFANSNSEATSKVLPPPPTPHVRVNSHGTSSTGSTRHAFPTPPVTRNVQPVNAPSDAYEQPKGM